MLARKGDVAEWQGEEEVMVMFYFKQLGDIQVPISSMKQDI